MKYLVLYPEVLLAVQDFAEWILGILLSFKLGAVDTERLKETLTHREYSSSCLAESIITRTDDLFFYF